jgi:riboflavin kinase/FMN adenylyltransferase
VGAVRIEHIGDFEPVLWPSPVVTIGNFDGVHRGHQALIGGAVARAEAEGGTPVVLTFDPHPARVLTPDRAPASLMTLDQRAEIMAALGVKHVVALAFDGQLAQMNAEEFSVEILHRNLRARAVLVGEAFHFGRGREGSIETLRELGPRLGFSVVAVPPILHEGAPVSSSRVREALEAGAVRTAAVLLGRPFFLDGTVARGDGRGRELGVPTANVEPDNETLPALGVYACWCRGAADERRAAVVNVGRRPTFGGGAPVVEAHLLDWAGDLYGRRLRLEFTERLRSERTFADAGALLGQIQADIATARGILEKA